MIHQVAEAPHARSRAVQSLTELDSDAMFALPAQASDEGVDFALLSSVLYPQVRPRPIRAPLSFDSRSLTPFSLG